MVHVDVSVGVWGRALAVWLVVLAVVPCKCPMQVRLGRLCFAWGLVRVPGLVVVCRVVVFCIVLHVGMFGRRVCCGVVVLFSRVHVVLRGVV